MRFSSRVLSILLVILQIVFLVPFANAETHSLSECITSDGKTTEVFKLRLARVQRLNGCRQSKSLASCEKELWIGSGALAAAAATSGALVGIGKIRNTKSSFCKAVTWIPGRSENIWSIASFDSALMHLFSSETVYANSCQIRAPDLWQKHRRLMQASIRTLDRDLDTARQNQQVLESELARRGAPRTYESIIDQHPDVYNAEVDANNAYGDAQDELKEATARGKGKYTEEMKQWRETVATKREVWVNSRRRLDKLLSAKMGNPTAIPQNVRDELNKGITAAKADVERLSAARAKYSELSLQAAKANQFQIGELLKQMDQIEKTGFTSAADRFMYDSFDRDLALAASDKMSKAEFARDAEAMLMRNMKNTNTYRHVGRGRMKAKMSLVGLIIGGVSAISMPALASENPKLAADIETLSTEIDLIAPSQLGCGTKAAPFLTSSGGCDSYVLKLDDRNQDFLYLPEHAQAKLMNAHPQLCSLVTNVYDKAHMSWQPTKCGGGEFGRTVLKQVKPVARTVSFKDSANEAAFQGSIASNDRLDWVAALEARSCCSEKGPRPSDAECAMYGIKVKNPVSSSKPTLQPARQNGTRQ